MVHAYRGCNIYRSSSVNWRWESWIDPRRSDTASGAIYADTLEGMRELIRYHVK